MDPQYLDQYRTAYTEHFEFQQENLLSALWYMRRMLDRLRRQPAQSLLSLGIGHQVVARGLIEGLAGQLEQYTIVEGSPAMIDEFRANGPLPSSVRIVQDWFEAYAPLERLDAIEMGFVLEHVEDPALILKRYAAFLKPGGVMFVAVPNAQSLHRRVGHAAKLLDDMYRLSLADLALGHRRYFDMDSLLKVIGGAGLRVLTVEGIFLKPLTTAQLQSLELPAEVVHAFYTVGSQFPSLSNMLYVECAH